MKRVRICKPKGKREGRLFEVLPPDPRDPDIVRAKRLDVSRKRVHR